MSVVCSIERRRKSAAGAELSIVLGQFGQRAQRVGAALHDAGDACDILCIGFHAHIILQSPNLSNCLGAFIIQMSEDALVCVFVSVVSQVAEAV